MWREIEFWGWLIDDDIDTGRYRVIGPLFEKCLHSSEYLSEHLSLVPSHMVNTLASHKPFYDTGSACPAYKKLTRRHIGNGLIYIGHIQVRTFADAEQVGPHQITRTFVSALRNTAKFFHPLLVIKRFALIQSYQTKRLKIKVDSPIMRVYLQENFNRIYQYNQLWLKSTKLKANATRSRRG